MSLLIESLPMLIGLLAQLALVLPIDDVTRADVLADLAQLRSVIESSFSYAEDKRANFGLDVDALCRSAADALPEHPTRRDALAAITHVVAGLQDGHASVALPATSLLPPHKLPLTLCDTTTGPAVLQVSPDLPPTVDVKVGDVVVAIAGEPIGDRIRRLESIACGSTPGQRRRIALSYARHVDAPKATIELDRAGRGPLKIDVPADLPSFSAPRPAARAELQRVDGGAIALLRVHSFALTDAAAWSKTTNDVDREPLLRADREQIRAAFRTLAGARGLVLDLRGNPGGTDLLGQELVGHLVASPFTYYDLAGFGAGVASQRFPVRVTAADGIARFDGPLVVLIDEGSFSVTDNVCAALHDLRHGVRFIGKPTGGGTGAPRPFPLPRTGATATFCTMRVWSPSGTLIEGRGTVPDIEVTPTAADVAIGFDRALDVAIRALQ